MAHGPAAGPVGWLVAAVCALAGGARLGCGRGEAAARSEAAMGLGMAAMAAAHALGLAEAAGGCFAGYFGACALWELALLATGTGPAAHRVHHLLGAAAMAYLAVAMPGAPLLVGAGLLYFGGALLLAGARLLPAGPGPKAPPLAAACRVAMGTGMLAMLLAG